MPARRIAADAVPVPPSAIVVARVYWHRVGIATRTWSGSPTPAIAMAWKLVSHQRLGCGSEVGLIVTTPVQPLLYANLGDGDRSERRRLRLAGELYGDGSVVGYVKGCVAQHDTAGVRRRPEVPRVEIGVDPTAPAPPRPCTARIALLAASTHLPRVVMSALPNRFANGVAPWNRVLRPRVRRVDDGRVPAIARLRVLGSLIQCGVLATIRHVVGLPQPSHRFTPAGALAFASVAGSQAWCW